MRTLLTRRRCVLMLAAGGAALATRLARAEEAPATGAERELTLFNTHTRETVQAVFRRGGTYVDTTLVAFRALLRDHRNGQSHDMDVGLYEQLADLAAAARRPPFYEIISGYRSPESNAKMATPGSGVAAKSLHMQGRALDVRLRDYDCADLRDLALAAKQGGVGYYQRSNFVHLDTGAVRSWVG